MKKSVLLFLSILLSLNLSFSQTESEFDSLLIGISKTENSIGIVKTKQAEKIIAFGEKSLPILAEFFTDSTLTEIKSECHNRNLTKGELAIIIADRIEGMPFALLTGVQNCLLEFCKNNPNLIEYYLPWINQDDGKLFKKKYINWLASYDRKSKSERRKEKRKLKNEKVTYLETSGLSLRFELNKNNHGCLYINNKQDSILFNYKFIKSRLKVIDAKKDKEKKVTIYKYHIKYLDDKFHNYEILKKFDTLFALKKRDVLRYESHN